MSAQPGFFGRIKNNFTQYAAGTDDLSQLSETQQKLLRREALGRLGASLYRNGDFGEAMQQQGEINAKRLEQMQAAEQARAMQERWSALNPNQGALVQPGGVAPPQAPRLLQSASANPQPGVPAARGAAPAQAAGPAGGSAMPTPQQAATALRDASAQRQRYEMIFQQAMAANRPDEAKMALDAANAFAAQEEYFAPIAAQVNGREVLVQASKTGGERYLDAAPAYTDTVRTMIQFGENPEAYQRRLAERAAGASRMTVNTPFESAFDKTLGTEQAKQMQGFATQAAAATETIQQLGDLRQLLSGVRTGATPELLAQIGRYFGTENATTLEAVRAAAMPFVLSRMQQLGGGDSNEELRAIRDALPNFGITPEANEIILGSLERQAQRSIGNYQQALQFIQTPGNRGLTGFIPTVRIPGVGQSGAAAGTPTDDWDY